MLAQSQRFKLPVLQENTRNITLKKKKKSELPLYYRKSAQRLVDNLCATNRLIPKTSSGLRCKWHSEV